MIVLQLLQSCSHACSLGHTIVCTADSIMAGSADVLPMAHGNDPRWIRPDALHNAGGHGAAGLVFDGQHAYASGQV